MARRNKAGGCMNRSSQIKEISEAARFPKITQEA